MASKNFISILLLLDFNGDLQVTDLGAVLHMVGGTAASYMIFFLPGLLLINAAIVKRTASMGNLAEEDAVIHLMPHSKLFEASHQIISL